MNDNLEVIRDVTAAFDRLNLAWALGGSWASSFHGVARFTQDADFMTLPFASQIDEFLRQFTSDYYLSKSAVADAIKNYSSFNVVHTKYGFKADVFIVGKRPFDRSILNRRVTATLFDTGLPINFPSAEDILLLKLEWFRIGDEQSGRQWEDILGIIRTQNNRLDTAYLETWSREIGVSDLHHRATKEAAS